MLLAIAVIAEANAMIESLTLSLEMHPSLGGSKSQRLWEIPSRGMRVLESIKEYSKDGSIE